MHKVCSISSSIYQIPNTEHTAYRLVRTLVYKRGVGIREKGFGLPREVRMSRSSEDAS